MEAGQSGGVGGGGPAPFLLKTYDMIDDESTDEIVSWSSGNNSFVVWEPLEFARSLLPLYFKHNNFSSFIRQLNTYGFRKIDPERWEFANEDFAKDKKHMLKNIHRRKPIHSHSHSNGSFGDVERAALEEEIERLLKEKSTLQTTLLKFKQQQSGMKLQLEDLKGRVQEMEQRQQSMISFLGTAVHKPSFVEHLFRMAEVSMGLSALHKKRRLPGVDYCQDVEENSSVDNHSSILKPEFGHLLFHDFSNMLTLDVSPTVSDCNLVSGSLQSSNEDGGGPLRKSPGALKDVQTRRDGLFSFRPATLELSDTGVSIPSKESRQVRANEEDDCHIPFYLNLTLASCPLQGGNSNYSAKLSQCLGQDTTITSKFGSRCNSKEPDMRVMKFSDENAKTSSLEEAPTNNEVPVTAQGRVNDVFWEQFLTEKPGSLETEEACSSFRDNPFYEKKEERKSANGKSFRNQIDMQQLTL